MVPPTYLTRFIGREQALNEIGARLGGGHVRLLTLWGPGGCGKTRLAAELATTLVDEYEDGLRWVDLVGVSAPDLLSQAIASTLQLNLAPGQDPTDGLVGYLHNRNLLLILDNCEHLVHACAQLVTHLLHHCPYLQVLITSRETLRVGGEYVWTVPPLPFPNEKDAQHEALEQYPAIQLFVERARAVSPDFALTNRNAGAVSHICRRLEGMPLSIELAAARVNLLAPDQIVKRLELSLPLLSGGPHTGDPRHRALRDTIEWSYTLLPEQEQVLLRRLGVFYGGFALEAAEVVCAATAGPGWMRHVTHPTLDARQVLNLLASLVNKSLVVVENQTADRKRFHLLETIRHFALEKVREAGEEQVLRDLHLHYFTQFAEMAEPKLVGAQQLAWVARLTADYDNFRAALSWAIENGDQQPYAERAWTLSARLFWYWGATDQFNEGRRWLEQSLEVGAAKPELTPAQATAMARAGNMAWLQGDFETATTRHKTSLRFWEAQGDDYGRAAGYNILARIALYQGNAQEALHFFERSAPLCRRAEDDRELGLVLTGWGAALAMNGQYRAAREKTQEALSVFRDTGDIWGESLALGDLGWAAFAQGDDARARVWLEEALQLRRELGTQWLTAQTCWHLGELYRFQPDLQRAEALFEQCQAVAEEIQATVWVRSGRLGLGFVALSRGRLKTAAGLFQDSLHLAVDQGEMEGILQAIEGIAMLAAHKDEQEAAARLAGACDSHWEASGLTPSRDASRRAKLVTPWLRQDTLQAIYEQGTAMALDDISHFVAGLVDRWQRADVDVHPVRHDVRIVALGPTQVFREGRELVPADWTFAKPKELLFYLVANPPQTKEEIGAVFWPDASPTQLRQSFRTTMYHLRQGLGRREWVLYDSGRYRFNRDLDYWYDVERFETQLAQAHGLRETDPGRAIQILKETTDLYRGMYIADITVDEWALVQRRELERKFVQALLALGRLLFGQTAYIEAETVYRRILGEDPLVESAHRGLMRCYTARGERGLALRHYEELVELMYDEMGAPPSTESRELHGRISRGEEVGGT